MYSNLDIHYKADIKGGLLVLHPSVGIVISGQAKIGKNLTLTGGNVIGAKRKTKKGEFEIGDNCNFGANATLIGPVVIANNISIGASACVIKNCLNNAGVSIEQVDAINTHGTSTPLGDVAELKAISDVFGDHAKNININSTKSMTGHLLGAAGAVEAISVILSIKNGIVPPTINHKNSDENINPSLNLTLNNAQKRDINIAMSNTFGFGGHNACVIFKKYIN